MNSAMTALADRQAQFQFQLDAHRGIVVKVVSSFAWGAEDQQDLAQEIVVQLWSAFPKYDSRRAFSTWMYQVALNTAISWSRKSKLRRHAPISDEVAAMPASGGQSDDSRSLYMLIDGLDALNRALMILYMEERSHSEIAEILGISAGNVATKLSRLKARLRIEAEQN